MSYKQPINLTGMNLNNIQQGNTPINPMFPAFPMNFNPNLGMINPMMPPIPLMNPMAQQVPMMMMNMPMGVPPQQRASYIENKKVWVSKIPENVSDTFMLKLLEACGQVVSWKRVTDSKGKLNSFGICEYQAVESMLKCLRMLNGFPIEDSELQIKVGSETEEFLKKWRERKKEEWIDSLRQKGFQVDLSEIKRKENKGEPLDWELQLVSKDNETNKLLFEIMSQRTEIETYARQSERPEQYLKDLKELAQGSLSQHFESERERERMRLQSEKAKKMEKLFRDEEKKWEKHEDDRDREKSRRRYEKDYLSHQKKRLIEKDLNYESDNEKRKISQNPKKYEEHLQLRLKEREYDEMMRQRECGDSLFNSRAMNRQAQTTEIAVIEDKEPIAKTKIEIEEYRLDEADQSEISKHPNDLLQLNIVPITKAPAHTINHSALIDDDDNDDPYTQKQKLSHIEINPETERQLLEMSKEAKCHLNSSEDDTQSKHSKAKLILKQVPPGVLRDITKSIIELIPKDKDDLLKYPINWSIVDDYQIKQNKIKPWLERKVNEYFDVEPSFIDFIVDKIGKSNPYEIFDALKTIFEGEDQAFMCKMWKNLIFETLKVEKILQYQREVEEKDKPK